MQFKIPFSGRSHHYTPEEISTVAELMQTANTLTQGKYQEKFQEKFRQVSGARHAFALNNATSGLELAAQLCLLKEGDEVIIPSHTFTSSAYPFAKKGAKLVWADIDPRTRVVSAESIEKCITSRSRAIVVVHLYGYGADMPAIMKLAKRHNLLVIEDAAQALGVEVEGQKVGSYGDIGVFSFHSHKNLTTLGEGGMIVLNDSTMADVLPMLRHNGGRAYAQPREDYWIPAMSDVDFPEYKGQRLWPNNYCMGEVEAALGHLLLDRLEKMNEEKRQRALKFIDGLVDYPELEFHRVEGPRHNYHLLVGKLRNGMRDQFMRLMTKEHGIQCVVQYYPLNRYPFYQKLGFGEADCPVTDEFFDNMVSFPFQHTLTSVQLDEIQSATRNVLDKLRTMK